MSVAATSSPSLNNKLIAKRPYEAPDAAATLATTTAAQVPKRGRGAAGVGDAAGAAGTAGAGQQQEQHAAAHPYHQPLHDRSYVLGASALTALRGLFPEMSEQTVTEALYTCGDDIDAAVRRLSELRLRGAGGGEEALAKASAVPPALKAAPAAADASGPAASRDGTPAVGDAARATPGPAAAAHTASPPPAGAAAVTGATAAGAGPSTSEDQSGAAAVVDGWADAVVREMAVATDVGDARDRARTVLRGFAASLAAAGGEAGGPAAAAARTAALERDCCLLKRAVALQAARLADAAAVRAQLDAARGRVHALELANYGLAAHLAAAAGGAGNVLLGGGGGQGGGGGGHGGGGAGGGHHGHGHHHQGPPAPDVY